MEQLCWNEPFTWFENNLGISHFLLAFLLLLLLFCRVFVLPFAFRPLAYTPRAAAGIVFLFCCSFFLNAFVYFFMPNVGFRFVCITHRQIHIIYIDRWGDFVVVLLSFFFVSFVSQKLSRESIKLIAIGCFIDSCTAIIFKQSTKANGWGKMRMV